MNYIEAYKLESYGHKEMGIKLDLSLGRALTEVDKINIRKLMETLYDDLMTETVALDPETAITKEKIRDELLSLFSDLQIYIEEIPNQYCSRWCHVHLPWYRVYTKVGPITVGWRKRVIQISWTEPEDAEKLFPNESSTKDGKMIHAWGLEKAKEYINTLLKADVNGKADPMLMPYGHV